MAVQERVQGRSWRRAWDGEDAGFDTAFAQVGAPVAPKWSMDPRARATISHSARRPPPVGRWSLHQMIRTTDMEAGPIRPDARSTSCTISPPTPWELHNVYARERDGPIVADLLRRLHDWRR